jgi:isochorismate synthase
VRATTHRLEVDVDIVALGARSGLLWSRQGLSIAGVGIATRIPLERSIEGARAAQSELSAVGGGDVVGFAALPFDKEAPGEIIVPEIAVRRGPDQACSMSTIGPSRAEAVQCIESALASDGADSGLSVSAITSTIPPEEWRDDVVAPVRDRIRAGELIKVVLARELIVDFDRRLSVVAVIEHLARTHPAAMVFAVDGFIGASPELLVAREGDEVRAHPLAGTIPRAADPDGDSAAMDSLLESSKDRWEHRITIEWLLDELLPFCSYVDAEPEPSIVSLPNVHHLGTRVEGRLSRPPTSLLELVDTLHPTPAVGGSPQGRALEVIAEVERADRGRYAGPVGWVDGDGNGEFAVGIRSGEVGDQRMKLMAGVGVVADSDPEAELAETRAKFEAMLEALRSQ